MTGLFEGGGNSLFAADKTMETQTEHSLSRSNSNPRTNNNANANNSNPLYDGNSKIPINTVVNTFRVGSSRRVRTTSAGGGNW